MNLYHLSQEVNDDYETYDSCVVMAENEDQARLITPHNCGFRRLDANPQYPTHQWAGTPDEVVVKLIGVADSSLGVTEKVIIASFNAG